MKRWRKPASSAKNRRRREPARPEDAPRPAHHREPQRPRRQGRRAGRGVSARREEAVEAGNNHSVRDTITCIMEIDVRKILEEFVDLLMPDLSPHEASMYIFLLRNSYLSTGSPNIRIGQRTIAQRYGRGPKMAVPSRAHVTRQFKTLAEKGCIRIGDTNREGTLYEVRLPSEIPSVVKKLGAPIEEEEEDFYTDPAKRKLIHERDKWICHYCGESVTAENATLDHFDPQCGGKNHSKANLRTACLLCNSIKSGKSFDEAAPYLLKSFQERRLKKSRG